MHALSYAFQPPLHVKSNVTYQSVKDGAMREYPEGARGFPRTRHGIMFHHIVGTVTRQLHDVGLRSFVQHLRRTHAPPVSNLVFTSLMGVTTTNGVSHHLVLCLKKKCHDMFLADPIEVLNHLVFAFTGVTLNCIACKSRKACLSLLWWIRGQQLPNTFTGSPNILATTGHVPRPMSCNLCTEQQ